MDKKEYLEYVHTHSKKTNELKTLFFSFLIGGIICCIGQGFSDLYHYLIPSFSKDDIGKLVSITMIFLGSFLTGIGLYDKIGAIAGGGSIIPITGFANSIVAPAMEFNKEGIVLGVMAKMFTIAGPIIVTGISSSVLVGIIYWVIGVV